MYLIIIFLPLVSSFISGILGRKIGPKGASIVPVICLIITFFCSFFAFYEVALIGSPVYIKLTTWISSEVLHVDWGFQFDTLTVIMCCVVTFVSSLVHLYSTEYMSHDPHLPRFMSYLSLFTFFMLILITADNYVQMFVGWEGVGLCSYLLINFWFTRIQANKAAIKAMVLNRVGDFGLVLGIFTIFINYKAVDYATVFALTPYFVTNEPLILNLTLIDVIGIFLFVGATGKSAQLGLHTWLPDAMEGPTPVSALIHAATMVTAGVFLIARSSPIYEYSPTILKLITIFGACTAFFAATVGLLQNDLKKVIAYSTCSQLGYMVFACGLSNYYVGVFHLVNHAFFKALLFLGAGSVIHAVADEQDMRKMGGLKNLVPFTYSMMTIGSLALIGFPFLTGFYSKDVILEVAYGKYSSQGHFSYLLGSCGAFLTAFYSTRLVYLTFLSSPNGYRKVICAAYDSSYQICISLAILSIPSMFIGFYTKDMLIGMGTDFWGNSIYILPENMNMIDAEFIDHIFKVLPVILSLCGATSSFLLYTFASNNLFNWKISFLGRQVYNFLNKKWFFDKVYNEYIGQFFFTFGYNVSYKIIDRGIIEVFGPMGLSASISRKSLNITKLQSGYIYHYTLLILLGSTLILSFRQFWGVFNGVFDSKSLFIFLIMSLFLINDKDKNNINMKSFFKIISKIIKKKREQVLKTNNFSYNNENFKYLKTRHSFHLVDPSPWPLVAGLGAFCMTSGGVSYMHNFIGGGQLCLIGLSIILYVMYMWWRDIIREATFEEQHTFSVQRGLRLGMILFIVSEIMFFFAFFWAFFHSSLSPTYNIGGIWPPIGIETIQTSGLPLTNTGFLLSSGATVTWAHHALIVRAKKQSIIGLILTIILASIFTLFQGLEYFDAPFTISDSVFGSCFYMATGFHGFHVFVGTIALIVSLVRIVLNHFTSTHHFGFESAAWYWHFVDVVWLFLFVTVYWWGGIQ